MSQASNAEPESGPFKSKVRSAWAGFKAFIGRDNVLEVSVGLIISTSFQRIVSSLVSDILMPLISLLPFFQRNMASKFAVLRRGPNYPYNTVQQADDDGAVTLNYGSFIDATFNFIFVGICLYLVARGHDAASKNKIIRMTTKCEYCRKQIPEKSLRCSFCTSWRDGREERETSALAPSQEQN
ncbi:large-conductance mechanosensitive channel [Flagelloscypha sp. PMI_526]|nr:large-conductance mechanosensitive channel [Flagelloscypha sp. PMI_526]